MARREESRKTQTFEGSLGPPAAYVRPAHRRSRVEDHPLSRLAAATRVAAREATYDPLAAFARDAQRFAEVSAPAWGMSDQHLPEVLVIGRIKDDAGCYPLDRFIGIPRYPWTMPLAIDALLRSASTLVSQQVVTCFGEVVLADLYGVILTRYLHSAGPTGRETSEPSNSSVLRDHLNPRRPVKPVPPELFTWSSAFNSAKDRWPGVAGFGQLMTLTAEDQTAIADHMLGYGLEALAAEAENKFVRLAAGRLLAMCDAGLVDLQVVRYPEEALPKLQSRSDVAARITLPEHHALAYFPASISDRSREHATLLVTLPWIASALNREIVALTHLVRIASTARDDYFGLLAGTDVAFSRELGLVAESSRLDVASARADRLAATFLDEAVRFDNRIYGLHVNRDEYCRTVERRSARAGFYDDPPEPRTRLGTGVPGTNG